MTSSPTGRTTDRKRSLAHDSWRRNTPWRQPCCSGISAFRTEYRRHSARNAKKGVFYRRQELRRCRLWPRPNSCLFGSAYADSKAFFYIGPDQRVCLVLENVREIPPGGRRFKRTEAVGKKTRNAARTLFFSRDSLISEAGRPERLRLLAGALDDAGAHSYGRSWGRSAPSPKETPEFLHPGQAAGAMGPSLLHVPLLGLRSLSD
jgi:hypothetical protein